MSKLWDALKRAEQQGEEKIVSDYEESFEDDAVEHEGDIELNIPDFMSEEYRKLINALRSMGKKKDSSFKVLLVTASRAGEGSTTVATSLAASLAADRRSSKVLLMDANLRNPEIHHYLGLPEAPGLVDVVEDHENRMRFFRASPIRGVPNLHIMTCGSYEQLGGNTVRVLESAKLASFMREIRSFYDFIVVDSPPVTPYSDALSLSRSVDGMILVIDAQNTRWDVARRASEQLKSGDAPLVGTVLNQRKMHIPKQLYKRL